MPSPITTRAATRSSSVGAAYPNSPPAPTRPAPPDTPGGRRAGRRACPSWAGYPGGRLPEAEDIAHAVAFFADPATRFITGQVLIIDGGRSVGLSPS